MGFTVRFLLGAVLVLLCLWNIEATNGETEKTTQIANLSEESTKPKTDSSIEDKNVSSISRLQKSETYKKATQPEIQGWRSLDIEKYVSQDFHNKNYQLPISPDTEKFINTDYDYHSTPHHHEFNFDSELTTPKTTSFDKKYKKTVESLEQKLEHIDDSHELSSESESKENINLEKLSEETKKNETKAYLNYLNYKSIIKNDTAEKNSLHKDLVVEAGTNLDFRSSYNKTTVIDEDDSKKNNTIIQEPIEASTISNKIQIKGDHEKSESFTVKSTILTTRKSIVLTKPPSNRNASHISILSNNIETETVKAVNLILLTTEKSKGDREPTTTHRTPNDITKRGSIKYSAYFPIPSTEPTTVVDNSIDTKAEQLLQENQLVPIHVEAPVITKNNTDETTTPVNAAERTETQEVTPVDSKLGLRVLATTESQTTITTELATNATAAMTESETKTTTSPTTELATKATATTESETKTTSPTTELATKATAATTESEIETTTAESIELDIKTIAPTTERETTTELTDSETKTTVGTTKIETKPTTTEITDFKTAESSEMAITTSATTITMTESELETTTASAIVTRELETATTTEQTSKEPPTTTKIVFQNTTPIEKTTTEFQQSTTSTEEITTPPIQIDQTTTVSPEETTILTTENEPTTTEIDVTTQTGIRTSKGMVFKENITTMQTTEITTVGTTEPPGRTSLRSITTTSTEATTVTIQETTSINNSPEVQTVIILENRTKTTPELTFRKLNPTQDIITSTPETDTSDSSEATSDSLGVDPNHDSPGDNSGTIAAIVISCVAAVCLVLLAALLFVMRKRQKRFNYGQRCTPVSLDDYSMDNVSVYNSVRRKAIIRSSKRSYGNPAFEDPASVTHPLNFPALGKFAINFEDIRAEFEEIPIITARTNELPEGCDTKNRYANVIPLPETRVFLTPIDGYPNSDYINANYVTGPKNTKGYYIACQAPLQNTVDDFWRMIWEQQCKVILMLTHLFENGVEKCVDYLPPSEVLDCHRLFGDYQVTLKKREVKDKYIISILQLKNMVSNSWREVTHFWYLGWPEKGVPNEANSLIAFLIEARSYMKSSSIDRKDITNGNLTNGGTKNELNPVVVHCSPGTGRTGVVIACDIAIREFEQTRLVDVPRIVYKIRRDRASSVQTKEQYAFIYKVINLYATKLTGGALDSL